MATGSESCRRSAISSGGQTRRLFFWALPRWRSRSATISGTEFKDNGKLRDSTGLVSRKREQGPNRNQVQHDGVSQRLSGVVRRAYDLPTLVAECPVSADRTAFAAMDGGVGRIEFPIFR